MIYLDNSATTRPFDSVIDVMVSVMREGYYNPSALYKPAVESERQVSDARERVRARLHADQIIFTSGGTESNNLAICGSVKRSYRIKTILVSSETHASILNQREALESRGVTVRLIPLTPKGLIDADALASLMNDDVSIIAMSEVSSETGAVQPLEDIIMMRDKHSPAAIIMIDAAQGFLHTGATESFIAKGADIITISAHKFHGPKGVAAIALSKRAKLIATTYGGKQESGLRPGTENLPGIIGMAAAIQNHASFSDITNQLRSMKMRLIDGIRGAIPDIQINGAEPSSIHAAPHIVNLSPPGVGGEVLVHALEREGVLVGTGSACSSKKKTRSQGFISMGIDQDRADRAVRISLSIMNTMDEMDRAAEAFVKAHASVYRFGKHQ